MRMNFVNTQMFEFQRLIYFSGIERYIYSSQFLNRALKCPKCICSSKHVILIIRETKLFKQLHGHMDVKKVEMINNTKCVKIIAKV